MTLRRFEKTLELLEFDRIREAAASLALSAEAAELIRGEAPSFDPAEVRTRKELGAAFAGLSGLAGNGGVPRQELPSVGFLLPALAAEGARLNTDEALALALFIERGEALRRFVLAGTAPEGGAGDSPAGEKLRNVAGAAPDCSALAEEVFRLIDRDGTVKDLPELKRIRGRIRDLTRDLEHTAARYGSGENTRRILQSPLPSQRDGRMVLAVKANFRGRIKGIVHEVSSTGQTIFVEPEESVEKNNRILLEQAALEAEIRRLLGELTARLSLRREDLGVFHKTVLALECLRAKARYSLESRGRFALEAEGGTLRLKQARHPLLGEGAVPIDLELDSPVRMVIITGPNTGGKTVSLKTLGLFVLMNQTGLALPAEETLLPVFDGVYADIGDEQSLSQSLSTFSGHINSIAGILKEASERSLVLLDELGAGTDPEEGGAIAMAVMDHFLEQGTTVILTTHHGILKNYGYGREGVENASVEFDRRTLSPTYRIVMGVPGESRALDIAARNGLPPALVARARACLDGERSGLSALITGLKEKHLELDRAARLARERERELREDRRRADVRELALRQREHQNGREGAGEFRRLLAESRRTLENLVREIREGELTREKTLRVKEFIRRLEGESAAMDTALEEEGALLAELADRAGDAPPGKSPAIAPGMEVLAGPSRLRGRALRRDRKAGGSWIVETGSVRVRFPETELVPAFPGGAPASGTARPFPGPGRSPSAPSPGGSWTADLAPADLKPELNLLGMRLEEALEALRRQIDGALLAGLGGFAVIHGKGDGILQRGVRDYLAGERAVADFYFARPELGGSGRTEVVLQG